MNEPAPRIYSAEYYDRLREIEDAHWWTLGMNDVMSCLLERAFSRGVPTSAMDLGCGSGTGLSWLRSHLDPPLVLGLDVSSHGLEHCRGRGAALLCAMATEIPVRADSFDLVLCNDVLQHVPDDAALLREAFRVLKPGGILYARANGRFVLPIQPGCLRLYTRKQLRQLLVEAGFEPLTVSYANALGSLLGVVRHKLRSARQTQASPEPRGGLRISPGAQSGKGLKDRVLRTTLRLEARLMAVSSRLVPFGHTTICVARKVSG